MEGPSIIILKEAVKSFKGKKVIRVSGNSKIDQVKLKNQKIIAFRSWGKHFIICFSSFSLKIHFLMFGSYRINESKDQTPRLSLEFANGVLNFYTCTISLLEEDLNEIYDWEVDVMSDKWNPQKAVTTLKKLKNTMICDLLLDQEIFAGAGNIIKNEVLYRVRLHPETKAGALNNKQRKQLVTACRDYSFEFYKWKKLFELKKHWLIYSKKKCPRCNLPVEVTHTGIGKRISFFCTNCQLLPIKARPK
ncbi:MAG: DNA-formamidopyrimidine glycosylase family protein [Chitinophagales bacterium]